MKLIAIGMEIYRVKDEVFNELQNTDLERRYDGSWDSSKIDRLLEKVSDNNKIIMTLDEIYDL